MECNFCDRWGDCVLKNKKAGYMNTACDTKDCILQKIFKYQVELMHKK